MQQKGRNIKKRRKKKGLTRSLAEKNLGKDRENKNACVIGF